MNIPKLHVDILASENFEVASNDLTQANKQNQKGEASYETLETIVIPERT